MGDVIVRLTVDKQNGGYSAKILSHQGGSSCGDGIDDEIVKDLLNAEINGFGELAVAGDSGKTCEYFEEKQAKKGKRYRPIDNFEEEERAEKQKELHLGYGV